MCFVLYFVCTGFCIRHQKQVRQGYEYRIKGHRFRNIKNFFDAAVDLFKLSSNPEKKYCNCWHDQKRVWIDTTRMDTVS